MFKTSFLALAALIASPVLAMGTTPIPRDASVPSPIDANAYAGFLRQVEAKYAGSSATVRAQVAADMATIRENEAFIQAAVQSNTARGYVEAKRAFDIAFQRACTTMGGC